MREALVALAVLALAVGVLWLRSETQSEHYATHPDSTVTIIVDADTNRSEPSQSPHGMAVAQLDACRLEVDAELVGDVLPLADDPTRFQVVLRPALDETDRVQYEGCVEDWFIDHLRLRVVSYERRGPFLPDEPRGARS